VNVASLDSAIAGLQSAQAGMLATSQNVAGSSVAGYVRRSANVNISALAPSSTNLTGTSFAVEGFTRNYSAFLQNQVWTQQSQTSYSKTLTQSVAALDAMMVDPSASIASALGAFFNAAGSLANEPTNQAYQQALVGSARLVGDRVRGMADEIARIGHNASQGLADVLNQANSLAPQLASINAKIVASAVPGVSYPSADLLDERDRITTQLQDLIGGVTLINEDGTASYQVQGLHLVDRQQANRFTNQEGTIPVRGDQSPLNLRLQVTTRPGTAPVLYKLNFDEVVSSNVDEGLLSKLVDANALAIQMAAANNGAGGNAQAIGLQLQQLLGGQLIDKGAGKYDFEFNGQALVKGTTANQFVDLYGTGNLTPGQNVKDLRLKIFDNGNVSYVKMVFDGLSSTGSARIIQSQSAFKDGQAGAYVHLLQSFVPTLQKSIDTLALRLMHDVNSLKSSAGNVIQSIFGFSATDSAGSVVTDLSKLDTHAQQTYAQLLNTNSYDQLVEASNPNSLRFDAAIQSWLENPQVSARLFKSVASFESLQFSGNEASGQLPKVGALDGAACASLEALRTKFSAPVTFITSSVANTIATWKNSQKSNEALGQILSDQKNSISGVNLDEEAANLVKYQQLYNASSKLIQSSRQMFDTLLAMVAGN
jgi:flagellar hook-associated protein 1 FlgK